MKTLLGLLLGISLTGSTLYFLPHLLVEGDATINGFTTLGELSPAFKVLNIEREIDSVSYGTFILIDSLGGSRIIDFSCHVETPRTELQSDEETYFILPNTTVDPSKYNSPYVVGDQYNYRVQLRKYPETKEVVIDVLPSKSNADSLVNGIFRATILYTNEPQ